MGIPLQALTFYRMPDQNPASTAISDLLDAIYSGLVSATDYRGTSLPSTHLWSVSRRRPTAVTEEVDATAPAGTPMTKTPALMWAGRIANAGTMAFGDSSAASVLQCAIAKNIGAYADWSSATPWTSGNFSGYIRAAINTTPNATTTIVRCFVSQETIFVQIIAVTVTNQNWSYIGATVEPYSPDTTNAAESDNRLYGCVSSGGASLVASTWLSTNAVFNHHGTAQQYHQFVFTPGAGTLIACGRRSNKGATATAADLQDSAGYYIGDIIEIGKNTATNTNDGNRLGTLRGIYCAGKVQSGRYLRNVSTDLYHFISADTSSANSDGFMLPAAA